MFKKITKKIFLKICVEVVLILLSFGMGFYFHWEIANLIFFLLFIILLLHPISSRFPAFGTIILLIATAILLVAKQDDLAETSAIWAYYLMIFTATLSFSELREKDDDDIICKDK
jgi:hypothetical membrane protein